ncbi:SLC13 family permease [Bacillus massiliglaciei]|uniref:SLC13 family permease n=1 Tax=Bacillus massiliglaciei TaxID=1816693 RepID=UPI000A8F7D1C|nr:SLC13 family permease [Bacillus massiliglaciei]
MFQPMFLTFIILACTLLLFIHGKVRADIMSIGALLILGLTGVIPVEDLVAGFSDPAVIILAALFIVNGGILNTGLIEKAGNGLLRFGAGSELKMLLFIMAAGGLLGAILTRAGMVSVLLPIIMSMALQQKLSPSRFLLPFAYVSSIGGVMTLIGTVPNLFVSDLLRKQDITILTFFDFLPIGLIALISAILFLATLGRWLIPEKTIAANNSVKGLSAGELAGMYKVYDRLHYLYIPAHSEIVGERLSELQLPVKYEITLIEIKRKSKEKQLSLLSKQHFISARADEVLHPDDVILVFGEEENVERLIADYELEDRFFHHDQIRKHFLSSKFGLTEILIMPNSDYENQTLANVHFREKYRCNVLAINRNGEYIQADVGSELLKPGDALLIHGEWESIERISSDHQDVIVIGSTPDEIEVSKSNAQPWIALGIMALMVVMLMFESIPPVVSVLTAAALMVVTGCIRSMEEAYQKVNWEPVLLLAAMIGIGKALETTGGANLISNLLAVPFSDVGPYGMLLSFYLLTMFLSQFIPYGASAILVIPIAMSSSLTLGVSPVPVLISIAVAASLALATPRASTIDALVTKAGDYKYKDFVLVGISLEIFICAIMIVTIPIFFPF